MNNKAGGAADLERVGVESGKGGQDHGGPFRIRVLHLARSFPNSVLPRLGLWTERLIRSTLYRCDVKVVSPVPYFPPLPGFAAYTRFRRIERQRAQGGLAIFHPRFVVGPGYLLRRFESETYYWGVHGVAERLQQQTGFHLIHAHFTYPDGVVAVRLGQRYRLPVIITEQAPWLSSMRDSPSILERSTWAVQKSAFSVALSRSARDSIERFTGPLENLRVIPNAIDDSVFTPPTHGKPAKSSQILFAGIIRFVKGVDVLLRALRLLADRGRTLDLLIAGESFYATYRRDEVEVQQMVRDLQLEKHVHFVGPKSPSEVADLMRESALLVLPSRAESFGLVLAEALACGTPVVATRCGGPEDIVDTRVGVLVPPEDPEALARGIEYVLSRRADYDPDTLHNHARERFSMKTVGGLYLALYESALQQSPKTAK